MNLSKFKRQEQGFTLVELILVITIIVLMTMGIYLKYRSVTTNNKVQLQMQDLFAISKKINQGYQSSTQAANALDTLNNTTAIAKGLVPSELISPPNIISRFGTTLTLTSSPALINGNPGYQIVINNINPTECALIGTSNFANEVDEIWLNGANRKATGTKLTSANVVAITTQCNSATSIGFRNRVYFGIAPELPIATRPNQTNRYFIPTLNYNVKSVAPSCGTSGATWTESFCSCPIGTEYNGFICESTAISKNCGYGTGATQGVNGCSALKDTKPIETFYDGQNYITQARENYSAATPTTSTACTAASGYWDSTTSICGGILPTKTPGIISPTTPVYQGGRYLPNKPNPQMVELIQDTKTRDSSSRCVTNGGNWDGRVCNYCPNPGTITTVNSQIVDAKTGVKVVPNLSSNPQIITDGKAGHAASSTWEVDRCVTPTGNW